MSATTHALRLPSEALFLGVSLLDRCQAVRVTAACHTKEATPCSLEQLGLTACACLALAAKMEAAAAPPLAAYLPYLTPGHTLVQLQQAEVEVLCTLDHKLSNIATTRAFLTSALLRLAHAGGASPALCSLCSYLAELTLLEYHLLQAPPSQLAAACLAYTALLLGGGLRSDVLRALTGYDMSKLHNTLGWVSAVHATVQAAAANSHPYAATIKYLHPGYSAVASIPAAML
jgi:G2/mitotic-specific cyclin 1/2